MCVILGKRQYVFTKCLSKHHVNILAATDFQQRTWMTCSPQEDGVESGTFYESMTNTENSLEVDSLKENENEDNKNQPGGELSRVLQKMPLSWGQAAKQAVDRQKWMSCSCLMRQ